MRNNELLKRKNSIIKESGYFFFRTYGDINMMIADE
jgi:hypothetical protein